MWNYIIGTGLIALIAKIFSEKNTNKTKKTKNKKKRIFISFAIEDEKYRDYLVGQSKFKKSPFSFVDMSVKKPWDEDEWKKKCRAKIKKCDGLIVLLSKNTYHSSGARWEIKCAKEEGIPIIGLHIKKNRKGAIPPELKGRPIIDWTWENLYNSINNLNK